VAPFRLEKNELSDLEQVDAFENVGSQLVVEFDQVADVTEGGQRVVNGCEGVVHGRLLSDESEGFGVVELGRHAVKVVSEDVHEKGG